MELDKRNTINIFTKRLLTFVSYWLSSLIEFYLSPINFLLLSIFSITQGIGAWRREQPNHFQRGSSKVADEVCLISNWPSYSRSDDNWWDNKCQLKARFVCEFTSRYWSCPQLTFVFKKWWQLVGQQMLTQGTICLWIHE